MRNTIIHPILHQISFFCYKIEFEGIFIILLLDLFGYKEVIKIANRC